MSGYLQSMGAGLQSPGWLVLLLLALVPLLVRGHQAFAYPAVSRLPHDELSVWIERFWRAAGAWQLQPWPLPYLAPIGASSSWRKLAGAPISWWCWTAVPV
ncbi:hypothetical protein [Methylobacillus glycogenes]|uniref:hypothetical protein n=1 Tax=Methylobacillus glycogenes TaxID=406 RepID=UPI001F2D5325|nr:hypothetical protein [Methylobacillus glycogenes]